MAVPVRAATKEKALFFFCLIRKSLLVCSLGVADSPVKIRWCKGKQLNWHGVREPELQVVVDEISAQNHLMILSPQQVLPTQRTLSQWNSFQHFLWPQLSLLAYNFYKKEKNAMFSMCGIQLALLKIHSLRDATFFEKARLRITFLWQITKRQ